MEEEHAAYERGLAVGPKVPAGSDVDLQMRVRLVDGDAVISDSAEDGGLAVRGMGACNTLPTTANIGGDEEIHQLVAEKFRLILQ